MPPQVDVVILEHDDAPQKRLGLRQLVHPLQHRFSVVVGGMGLSREDELHRAVAVVDELGDQIEIAHQQVGPLVRRETPRKADRQRLRIERL